RFAPPIEVCRAEPGPGDVRFATGKMPAGFVMSHLPRSMTAGRRRRRDGSLTSSRSRRSAATGERSMDALLKVAPDSVTHTGGPQVAANYKGSGNTGELGTTSSDLP